MISFQSCFNPAKTIGLKLNEMLQKECKLPFYKNVNPIFLFSPFSKIRINVDN